METPNVNLFIGYVDNLEHNMKKDYANKYYDKRLFYSCNKSYNFVKYVKSGSEDVVDYVDYSGNKEKSHGVFNETGLLSDEKLNELKTQLQMTQSPIWHGVISFTEEFGNECCNEYEKAYRLMKTEFPRFLTNAGLDKNNVIWFAGLHENTDNKHIHFSFFEKLPTRTKQLYGEKLFFSDGMINSKAINSFKMRIEVSLREIKQQIAMTKNDILKTNKQKLNKGEMMNKIAKLIFILPDKGRLSYDSENMEKYRYRIDEITNLIITNNEDLRNKFINFDNLLRKRDCEIIKIYKKNKIENYQDKLLYAKVMEDIYRRLGNQVICTVKQLVREQNKIEYETKNRLALKRIEKQKRKTLINHCKYLNELVNRETINCFKEFLQRLDEADYKRLVEEGIFD